MAINTEPSATSSGFQRTIPSENPESNPLESRIYDSTSKLNKKMREMNGNKDSEDDKRIAQDIDELKENLLKIKDKNLRNEALGELNEALKTIVQDFQTNEKTDQLQLKALQATMHKKLLPITQKLRNVTLQELDGASEIHLAQNAATFKFGGETVRAEMSDASKVDALHFQENGISLRLREAKPLRHTERLLRNFRNARALIPADLRKDVKDFAPVNLETFEFITTRNGKEATYIITPHDFLQVGSQEGWQKELQSKISQLTTKRDALLGKMMQETGGSDVREQTLGKRAKSLHNELKVSFLPEKDDLKEMEKAGKLTKKQAADLHEYYTLKGLSIKFDSTSRQIRTLEYGIEALEESKKTTQRLNGVDATGAPIAVVIESRGESTGIRREYYDKNSHLFRKRIYHNGTFNHKTGDSYSDEINYASDGSGVNTTYLQGTDKKIEESVLDTKGAEEKVTRYNDDGSVKHIAHTKLGIWDIYEKGAKVRTEIVSAKNVFHSVKEVIKLPGGEAFLQDALKRDPNAALMNIKELNQVGVATATRLLEAAVNNATEEDIKSLKESEWRHSSFASVEQKDHILALCQTTLEQFKLGKTLIRSPYANDTSSGNPKAAEAHRKIKDFWEDPALEGMLRIKTEWVDKHHPMMKVAMQAGGEELAMGQMRAMIARNLFFKKLPITEQTVKEEFGRVIETRERFKNIALFKDRNMLLAAHEEILDDKNEDLTPSLIKQFEKESGDRHVFAKPALQQALKNQAGTKGTLQFVRPESEGTTPEEHIKRLKIAKESILKQIRETPPPFTFVFDGHGSSDALYLSHGQIEGFKPGQGTEKASIVEKNNTIKITAEELASALKSRQERFADHYATPEGKDIIVLACCFNANFIRNVYDKMGDAPKPIAIGQSEYGQYSLFSYPYKYGSPFLSTVVGIAAEDKPSSIGTVFTNEFMDLNNLKSSSGNFDGNTNPSIYIPDENNRPMQITRNEPGMPITTVPAEAPVSTLAAAYAKAAQERMIATKAGMLPAVDTVGASARYAYADANTDSKTLPLGPNSRLQSGQRPYPG